MTTLLEMLRDAPELSFEAGDLVIEEDQPLSRLLILKLGEVRVVKGGIEICRIAKSGAVFGEISALLNIKPTASVHAVRPSTFLVIEDSRSFLATHPETTLEIARLLARRLRWLTSHYADELDDGDSTFWRYR